MEFTKSQITQVKYKQASRLRLWEWKVKRVQPAFSFELLSSSWRNLRGKVRKKKENMQLTEQFNYTSSSASNRTVKKCILGSGTKWTLEPPLGLCVLTLNAEEKVEFLVPSTYIIQCALLFKKKHCKRERPKCCCWLWKQKVKFNTKEWKRIVRSEPQPSLNQKSLIIIENDAPFQSLYKFRPEEYRPTISLYYLLLVWWYLF